MKLSIPFRVISLLTMVLLPSVAFAKGGGHGHAPQITDLFWFYINFTVYVVLISMALRKPFARFWAERRDAILQSVTAGERKLKLAEEKLAAAHEQHQTLNERIEGIVQSIRDEGHREASDLKDESLSQATRIEKQALRTAESEQESVKRALQAQLVDGVLSKAKEKLTSEVQEASDRARRDAALKDLRSMVS